MRKGKKNWRHNHKKVHLFLRLFLTAVLCPISLSVSGEVQSNESGVVRDSLLSLIGIPISEVLDSTAITSNYHFRSGPKNETYIVFDGICADLCNIDSSATFFPTGFNLLDIYWDEAGNRLFSDSTSIYLYDAEHGWSSKLFDSGRSDITFRIGTSGCYYFQKNDSCLYLNRFDNIQTPELLYKFSTAISDIKVIGDNCTVAFGNHLALLIDTMYVSLLETPVSINAIETLGPVFLYGTDEGLYYLNTTHHVKIAEGKIRELSVINNSLYIIYDDNSSAKLDGLSILYELLTLDERYVDASRTFDVESCKVLIEKDELKISDRQLCIIPNNGLYLLTGDELISLEENENMPLLHITGQIAPEDIIVTENDVLIKNDTVLLSCKSEPKPILVLDSNDFTIYPATDGNIFILTELDTLSLVFAYNMRENELIPMGKVEGEINYIAGDSAQYLIVAERSIYGFQNNEGIRIYNHTELIRTATLTQKGLIFSSESGIFLLNGMNRVTKLSEKGCKRILSDTNTLYIYYGDGTLLAYNLELLKF